MSQKTALISVYNKEGIIDFAQELISLGWQIIASGGTASALQAASIPVQNVAELVGGDPILDHRVVTLSREIHAALLSRDTKEDNAELKKLNIPKIDLVCVDLYPLEDEINNPNATTETIIQKTDMGGPALLRSAAKGGRITICDPKDRQKTINWLKNNEPEKDKFISKMRAKTGSIVAKYCLSSAKYHGEYEGTIGKLHSTCKYGENPEQAPAGLYSAQTNDPLSLDKFKLITDNNLSYNSLCDIDRLLQTITHIAAGLDINQIQLPHIAIAVKHGNACGASIGCDEQEVIEKMIAGDTRAIFGGAVMVNFKIDKDKAEHLLTYLADSGRRFLEIVVAPAFTDDAIKILKGKNNRCKLVVNPALESLDRNSLDSKTRLRYVRGGFLAQPNYKYILDLQDNEIDKTNKAQKNEEIDMLLAWAIGATSNSNTITIVRDGYLLGNGVGQQDRVGCSELAIKKARDAGHGITGASSYSDCFFPFVDGAQTLVESGVRSIFSYSGSIRDKEVIKYCKEQKVVLYLIPNQKGRGFFGH